LDVLVLKGCIVTIDAMGCQRDIAEKIISKDADYILAVKGNASTGSATVKVFWKKTLKILFVLQKPFHIGVRMILVMEG
jgi:predicted transposase YbfD/YdcC